ncbi:MAG: proprotein convertase P-domain-containing protein, partial [Opitutaceae bacterium]|nr:proprotein convertase P-domain-containing protein [Verrucomicrobiales bacterium]
MNPNSIPKQFSSWVCYCLAAIFIASTAFGQGTPSTQPGGAITINDAANASPYPSTVLVTNYVGAITRVTVTLSGVTHGYPDDLDVVLESPDGERVTLWSDAGGQFDVNSVDLTFDSSTPAAPLLPDEAQINSGRFRPTNNNPSGDPDPAISVGAGTDLGVFIGDDSTGVWRLFVNDDT